MIRNERQYRITKAQAEKFERALAKLAQTSADASVHPLLRKAQEDALKSQLEDLREEIEEYEALQTGKHTVLEFHSFEDIPRALIQARIVAGLTQRDLADRLGMKEQQIQRYEATGYASASLTTIQRVIAVLGLHIREDVFLPNAVVSLKTLFGRLKNIGISRDFVMERLIPRSMRACVDEGQDDKLALQIASIVKRVFGIAPSEIFGKKPLSFNVLPMQTVRFKVAAKVNESVLSAYTVYAHYLALLVLEATAELSQEAIPTDPQVVRKAILTYGEMSFENALKYVWSLGVPVLPLHDPGAFHGALWRVGGRNIIVLKQRTQANARWLFDLIHELYHAAKEPEQEERSIIEWGEIVLRQDTSDEEAEANQFADDVILGGRAVELAEMCAEEAKEKVQWLKTAVPRVAAREGVPVDSLANYLAYYLSEANNINWWGTATKFQVTQPDPQSVARNLLMRHLDLQCLNRIDRDLLTQAISD